MTQQKGIEVCGVMVFFMLTQSHIYMQHFDGYGDLV